MVDWWDLTPMPVTNCGARNPRSTRMEAPARRKAFWQRSFCCWAPAQLIVFDELRSTKSLRWAVTHWAHIVSAQRSWHSIQLLVHEAGSGQHLGARHSTPPACLQTPAQRQRSRTRYGIQLLGGEPGPRRHISAWHGIHLRVCVLGQHIQARSGLQLLVTESGPQRRSKARRGLSAWRSCWAVNTCFGHRVRAQCAFIYCRWTQVPAMLTSPASHSAAYSECVPGFWGGAF